MNAKRRDINSSYEPEARLNSVFKLKDPDDLRMKLIAKNRKESVIDWIYRMELLDAKDYLEATDALSKVTFNNLFARSIVEHKVTGKIFVDDKQNPQTFYIGHPYGMTLLLGKSDNCYFNEQFKSYALNLSRQRTDFEWMQVFPNNWNDVLQKLFDGYLIQSKDNIQSICKGVIELHTRINFKFKPEKYSRQKKNVLNPGIVIKKVDREMFQKMKGSVVPSHFWDSADDFF